MKEQKKINYQPLNPLKIPRFGDIATFGRLPYIPDFQGKEVAVVVLGIPYDGATTFRPGARFGPRAVRSASALCRNYHPEYKISIYDRLNVVDGGDVAVNPLNIQATFQAIEKHLTHVFQSGARPICMGGDHSILLPELRAAHQAFGELTLIQFDAHTDTGDTAWEEKYHHGTPIRRAIEEGLILGSRIFQIGIRGPLTSADQEEYITQNKINILNMNDFYNLKKRETFFKKIHQIAGKNPCYLSFDVDGVDPAFAPGTGTPVVGGMSSFEAMESIRCLKGLRLAGADVVEISPPYDHADLTSLLGAALVFEFLSLMAVA